MYKKTRFNVWDVGGQDKIRPLWRHYFSGVFIPWHLWRAPSTGAFPELTPLSKAPRVSSSSSTRATGTASMKPAPNSRASSRTAK